MDMKNGQNLEIEEKGKGCGAENGEILRLRCEGEKNRWL